MKHSNSVMVLLTVLFFVPGCLEVKDEYIINPDGSGKVKHHVLFSPGQMKLGGSSEASDQELLKQAVRKEISKSKGVEAWKNVKYNITDQGNFSFTGVAYFRDISELDFHNQGFSGPMTSISMTENSDGTLSFEMTPGEQGSQEGSADSGSELTREEIQKKIEEQRQQFQKMKPMLSKFEDITISSIFNLPAPVQSSTNIELASPKRAGVFVSGEKIVGALETMVSSDEMMRERVKQGISLKDPPANPERMNEMIFGEKGPVKFTISGGGSPQFDYDREVRQAKNKMKQLTSELGIKNGGSGSASSGAGRTAGGRSEDGTGGAKYGFARKNKKTMKANWGIAFLDENKNELVLGFYPKTPGQDVLKKIKEKRGIYSFFDLEEPYVEITFTLDEEGSLSKNSVKAYSFRLNNFTRRPTSFSRSGSSLGEVLLKLNGAREKGSRVKGIFRGSREFKRGNQSDTYTWNLKFDLPMR